MLTKVRIIRGTNILELPLDETADSFYVTDISGLGTKQNVLMDDSFYIPGSNFIGTSSPSRNIVMKLSHKNRLFSMSDRRQYLSKFVSPGQTVTVELYSDDHPTVQTIAGVESVDTELFVKEPAIVISLMCQIVPFYGMAEVTYPNAITTPSTHTIIYEGTKPTGFKLETNSWSSRLQIVNADDTSKFLQHNNYGWQTPQGDYNGLRLSTVFGNRYFQARYAANNLYYSAMEAVHGGSTWLQLYPGENRLTFQHLSGSAISVTGLRWVPLYEGV